MAERNDRKRSHARKKGRKAATQDAKTQAGRIDMAVKYP